MGELSAIASEAKPTLEILVMRVQTKFRTAEEFVAAFRRFCTDNTCFVPTTTPRTVGIETGFSIRLADGTPMLRGLCVVLESWESDDNPYRRPGVRLGVRTLTRETKPIFDRLRDARLAVGSSPDIATQAALAEELERPTVQMPPLFPDTPEPHDCTHEDAHEDATETMDAVPLPIDAQDTSATERIQIDTVPMRMPVPTLLGVAPIAIPRTMTPRERVTMAKLTATGTQTVIVKEPTEEPEPSPSPAAVVVRRRSWWTRVAWRMRAWWRTRVWAWQRR